MHLAKVTSSLLIIATLTLTSSCSLFKRHRSVDDDDNDKDKTVVTGGAGQSYSGGDPVSGAGASAWAGANGIAATAQGGPARTSAQEQLQLDHASYDRAKALYDVGKHTEAATGFQHYLGDYPAGRHTEDAYRYLGMSLQRAGRPAEAVPHLKRAVENATSRLAQAEALLTLGECHAAASQWEEALATTFQMIPDPKLAARLALPPSEANRRRPTVSAPLDYQVKAYILRAQALAALGKTEESDAALARGKRMLLDASGLGITAGTSSQLKSEISYRELGLMDIRCDSHLHFDKTTEDTVLAALDHYYDCIKTAPALLCDSSQVGDAKTRYRDLVKKPLTLKEHLPPAGRSFKEASMEGQFVTEIKALIDTQVARRADGLRNIEECGLLSVF